MVGAAQLSGAGKTQYWTDFSSHSLAARIVAGFSESSRTPSTTASFTGKRKAVQIQQSQIRHISAEQAGLDYLSTTDEKLLLL
jgi:hypothetical protein